MWHGDISTPKPYEPVSTMTSVYSHFHHYISNYSEKTDKSSVFTLIWSNILKKCCIWLSRSPDSSERAHLCLFRLLIHACRDHSKQENTFVEHKIDYCLLKLSDICHQKMFLCVQSAYFNIWGPTMCFSYYRCSVWWVTQKTKWIYLMFNLSDLTGSSKCSDSFRVIYKGLSKYAPSWKHGQTKWCRSFSSDA